MQMFCSVNLYNVSSVDTHSFPCSYVLTPAREPFLEHAFHVSRVVYCRRLLEFLIKILIKTIQQVIGPSKAKCSTWA